MYFILLVLAGHALKMSISLFTLYYINLANKETIYFNSHNIIFMRNKPNQNCFIIKLRDFVQFIVVFNGFPFTK